MLSTAARLLTIECPRGHYLGQIEVLGLRQRVRLRRCKTCQDKGQPAEVYVFLDEHGRYVVLCHWSAVAIDAVPWPVEGWQ